LGEVRVSEFLYQNTFYSFRPEWPSIKTLLGEPNMTKRLLEIEKESLNETILRKLRKFIEYPKFTPDERSLSEQGARYDACVCRRQQLEGAVKRASGRLQRCSRLATVLADEHVIWQKHA
ncbi:hypothetical protein Anas_03914, partial [Armadillidium nasatum]